LKVLAALTLVYFRLFQETVLIPTIYTNRALAQKINFTLAPLQVKIYNNKKAGFKKMNPASMR
jgi:hypothetical protein